MASTCVQPGIVAVVVVTVPRQSTETVRCGLSQA